MSDNWLAVWIVLLFVAFFIVTPGFMTGPLLFEGFTGVAAQVVSGNDANDFNLLQVPVTMTAGETYRAHVQYYNTGSTTWTAQQGYKLGSVDPYNNVTWGVNRVHLAPTDQIAPNQSKAFAFDVTAPQIPGRYTFRWQMLQEGVEWFGAVASPKNIQLQELTVNVVACSATDCSLFRDQNVPSTMTAGQRYDVLVTMENNGATTWRASDGYVLGIENPAHDAWGVSRARLTQDVAPGDTVTFQFRITAPQVPGDYTFQWRMLQELQSFFGDVTPLTTIHVADAQNNIAMKSSFEPCDSVLLGGCGPGLPTAITPWTFWRNTTGGTVQIDRVQSTFSFSNLDTVQSGFGLDMCFYIFDENDNPVWARDFLTTTTPDPLRSGIREHGCVNASAVPGEMQYQQPNMVVFAQPIHLKPDWKIAAQAALWGPADPALAGTALWRFNVTETFVGGTSVDIGPGLRIVRFPIVDEVFTVPAGGVETTTWEPRRNDTNGRLYVWGSQVFLSMGRHVSADACVYVLTAQGTPKITRCYPHSVHSGTSHTSPPGIVFDQPLPVEPGEYIVGHHAFYNHTNQTQSVDGALYLHVTDGFSPELY